MGQSRGRMAQGRAATSTKAPAPGPAPGRQPRPRPPRRLGDGTGFPEAQPKPRPYLLHDQTNLVCLPILCALCVAGLADLVDCWAITVAFTLYIVVDLLWILIVPESLPRFPLIITVHHVITLALLSHPLRYPVDAHFTCLDGLVEISTFFLIARRHCKGLLSKACNWLYWGTTIALRFMLQPYLLWLFWRLAKPYPAHVKVVVIGSQTFLCFFNLGLVVIAVNASRYAKKHKVK